MNEVVLIGTGGHCRSCIDVIEAAGSLKVAGVVGADDSDPQRVFGYPFLGTDSNMGSVFADYKLGLIAVGQIRTPRVRIRLYEAARRHGADFPVIVSPHSYISRRASLGDGSIAMHGAIINAGASVGANCIINSQSLIEHGVRIGDHSHVSTGARVNGEAVVGAGSFIGSGAVIHEGVVIGEQCIVAAGSCIAEDLPNGYKYRSGS